MQRCTGWKTLKTPESVCSSDNVLSGWCLFISALEWNHITKFFLPLTRFVLDCLALSHLSLYHFKTSRDTHSIIYLFLYFKSINMRQSNICPYPNNDSTDLVFAHLEMFRTANSTKSYDQSRVFFLAAQELHFSSGSCSWNASKIPEFLKWFNSRWVTVIQSACLTRSYV